MHHFTWANLFFDHVDHHNVHMIYGTMIVMILILVSIPVYFTLRNVKKRMVPEDKESMANLFEVIVEQLLGLVEGIIGPKAPKYFPLVGGLFIYIFFSNLLSVVPGFLPPTDNINTNLACGVTVFLYYNYVGLKENGLGYLKHFMGPIIWLAPLMIVIELIGHVVRPMSLSLRLFGNITGDHLVLGIFSDLVPLLVPVVFLGLGVFVAFIQAFVFSLLSLIYVALATEHEEAH